MLKFRDETAGGAALAPEPSGTEPLQVTKGTAYSDAENSLLRAAFKSGDKSKVAEAHAQIAAARKGESPPAEIPQPTGQVTEPQTVQPPQEVDTTEEAKVYTAFQGATGGVVDQENLELLGRHTGPWSRGMDEIIERANSGDDDKTGAALADYIRKGEDQVIRTVYGGNEAAFKAGIQEIDQALKLLPSGDMLREAINEHFILADRASHQHILTLARMITKRLTKK